MHYFIHHPAPPLSGSIELVWYNLGYTVEHRRERALPNGRFQLIIDLSGGFEPIVVGMRSEYSMLETATLQHIISVVFRPGGTHEFFDVSAEAFYDDVVPLEQVWGADAPRLRDRLRDTPTPAEKFQVLEAALLRRRSERRQLHAAVRHALGRFQRDAHIGSVREVTQETGVSRRYLARLFREQVGITPKLYCRIHRFQRVVHLIGRGADVDWAGVALAGGYCDQAHLAHEFRAFSGMTPSDYAASDRRHVNHVASD